MKRLFSIILSLAYILIGPLAFSISIGASNTSEPQQVRKQDIAFVNVNVVPMDRERILKEQTLIVRDGRIIEMGLATKLRVPKGALRIDGRGKYLMPGLVDMHIHAYSDESDLFLFVANGVTTVRSMNGQPSHLKLRERIAKGETFGPSFYTCGPIINGLRNPDQARQVAAEHSNAGYDCIKIYNTRGWSREAYDAIIDAANSHNTPAVGHIPLNLPVEYALRYGLVTAEHIEQFLYYESGKFKSDRKLAEARIPYVAKLMKEAEISITPTLMVYATIPLMIADATSQELLKRPELKYINKQVQEKWITEQNNNYRKRFGPDRVEYFKDNLNFLKKFTKGLHDAGVRLLLGSDATEEQPFVIPGFSIHEEMRELISAGLTPYDALKAGTSNAAQVLKAQNEFGTVSVGLRADLILLEGNPLENIDYAARPAGVMVRGQWLPKAELKKRLDGLAASNGK